MSVFTTGDQARVAEVTRRSEAVGIGLPIIPNTVYGPPLMLEGETEWDGFYNIRGNVGQLDTTNRKAYVVVDFGLNTASWSDGPMQNHNPLNTMISGRVIWITWGGYMCKALAFLVRTGAAVFGFLMLSFMAAAQWHTNASQGLVVWPATNTPNSYPIGEMSTNLPAGVTNIGSAFFNPRVLLWDAFATQSYIYIQVALPPLPSNIVYTAAVTVATCSNGLTCTNYSIVRTNFTYTPGDSHVIKMRHGGCCSDMVSYVAKYIDPCTVSTLTTSTATKLILNSQFVCLTNLAGFGVIAPIFNGGTLSPDCLITDRLQLVRWGSPGGGSASPSNELINAEKLRVYDTTLAGNEREQVSWINPAPRALAPSMRYHDDESKNLSDTKSWVINTAPRFAVRELADTDGTYRAYCTANVSNWVWNAGAGSLIFDGVRVREDSNYWTQARITHRAPPQWGNVILTNAHPIRLQASSVTPLIEELAILLHLPHAYVPVIVSNTGVVDGYWLGLTNVFTNAIANLATTNYWEYGNYFNSTSDVYTYNTDFSGTNFDRGFSHVYSNTWLFQNEWLFWGVDVTNISQVITSSLPTVASTLQDLRAPYLASGTTWGVYQLIASNNFFSTLQVTALTNFTATNIVGGVTNFLSTNTTAVRLDLFEQDYSTTNPYTKFAIVSNPPPLALTQSNILSVTFMITNFVTTVTNIVGNTTNVITRATPIEAWINATNAAVVLTNWAIADGWRSADYGWDGIRAVEQSLTWLCLPNAINWINYDPSNLVSYAWHQGTNYVHDLVDTTLFGCIVPACATSDTVAEAELQLSFTNVPLAFVGRPFGTANQTPANNASCGRFRKDLWSYGGYQIEATIGDVVYIGADYTPDTLSTNAAFPCFGGICPDPYFCFGGNCCLVSSNPGFPTDWTVYSISNCADLVAARAAALENIQDHPGFQAVYLNDFVDRWTSFYDSFHNGSMNFWHGVAGPVDLDECCTDTNGLIRKTEIAFSPSGTDVSDMDPSGFVHDTDLPALSNAVMFSAGITHQPSLGLYNDIYPQYAARRDVYLSGALPDGGSAYRWLNTNNPPVGVRTNADFPDPLLYIFRADNDENDCAELTGQSAGLTYLTTNVASVAGWKLLVQNNASYLPQIGDFTDWWGNHKMVYRSLVTTWPVYKVVDQFDYSGFDDRGSIVSTQSIIVTNLLWPATGLWKMPFWTGWDNTNGITQWGLVANTTAQTNVVILDNFLVTNPIVRPDSFDVLQEWQVDDSMLILKFDATTNGFKYR